MYLELFQYSLQRGRQLVGLAFVADEEVVLYGGMKDFHDFKVAWPGSEKGFADISDGEDWLTRIPGGMRATYYYAKLRGGEPTKWRIAEVGGMERLWFGSDPEESAEAVIRAVETTQGEPGTPDEV